MTRTTHGHHIPGTNRNDEVVNMSRRDCGGVLTCATCRIEAFAHPHYQPTDNVNHPAHYTDGKIEVADFIADKELDFFLGNVVKYVARAGKKDPAKYKEDLKKAAWYLNYKIENLEG